MKAHVFRTCSIFLHRLFALPCVLSVWACPYPSAPAIHPLSIMAPRRGVHGLGWSLWPTCQPHSERVQGKCCSCLHTAALIWVSLLCVTTQQSDQFRSDQSFTQKCSSSRKADVLHSSAFTAPAYTFPCCLDCHLLL